LNTIVIIPLEAEEKSRVVPGKHWVVLQDLDTGTAVADMVLVLTAALTINTHLRVKTKTRT